MIIDVKELDLIKGIPWREELHPRGKDGKFSKIKSGSSVVAKNGTKGKVSKVTDTHYHIEKEDGKTSKVMKKNVIHAKDHKELTSPKKKEPKLVVKPNSKKPAKKAPAKPKASEGEYELFHGTRLPAVEDIKKNGFMPNGSDEDFGDAVYFKSPAFDPHDDELLRQKNEARKRLGHEPMKENEFDTKSVVSYFSSKGKEGAVIKATIPKEHVLDCTNGRPKDLQKIINGIDRARGDFSDIAQVMSKAILGKKLSDEDLNDLDSPGLKNLEKAWGRKIKTHNVSPYEVYAKAKGVKAIVDKLDHFTDEGWQIGVYDPGIISIKDVGKSIERKESGVELLKALIKALRKSTNAGYCLLHHQMTDEGLVLHVGVLDKKKHEDEIEKSLVDFRSLVESWKGDFTC